MKSYKLLLGFAVAAGANSALAAEPAPVLDINEQSANVNQSQPTDVESLQRMLQVRNRALIDMQQQIDDLQTEVSELRGVTEEQAYTINQILQRQRELYQEIDRRLSQAPAAAASNAGGASQSSIDYSSNLTENQSYDRAVNLVLKEKRYDQAIAEFKNFTQQYPNSSYSANAHYWLGQLLFNKADLSGAEAEFNIVINNYESSTKRSDAMLKLGMVAQKQGNNAKAKSLFERVISEYAGSSAAQLAKARLASL
ncbi:tol-pal system protein YbgF [Thalassotalea sp. HSM 43]|uniref:tol-pal system protein YbgF n=1 Tax=Thalassotalea sp. HSM 43 TaxID=2552945 RepID=UPI001081B22B|nr:tol-pal system protein YbgF [Thalassotalea sp. HSM 43]QBY05581.1 tol-pal system protein YbgF [Thalassotalea sp. HSM 43]